MGRAAHGASVGQLRLLITLIGCCLKATGSLPVAFFFGAPHASVGGLFNVGVPRGAFCRHLNKWSRDIQSSGSPLFRFEPCRESLLHLGDGLFPRCLCSVRCNSDNQMEYAAPLPRVAAG